MGEDKALLPFKQHSSLAHYQYQKLSTLFSKVYLSTKKDKFDFKANLLFDLYEESSPLVALVSAFKALPEPSLFVLSVDMPFITPHMITQLVHAHQTSMTDATIAKSPYGLEPLCGLYSKTLYPQALSQLKQGNHRLTQLLTTAHTKTLYFDQLTPFLNLNTPEEYQKALAYIASSL
jgi:molybdopterin-guanine dinucleotide biosynthesis protein A